MLLPNGSRPLPGWQIRFPVKQAENADTYRVADEKGALAFLKVFHPDRIGADRFTSDGELLEIAIMESLDHPGIPPIRQSGVLDDGQPFFLADLVPGETLDHRLARVVAISANAVGSLMRELCVPVSHLHSLPDPVTHHELTPSNVVLDPGDDDDDRPVLIDFGHARRASDGAASHLSPVDPHYLPNECYEAPVSAPTADVFSLGAIYYRALFGMPPWYAVNVPGGQADLRETLLRARLEPLRLPERAVGGNPDATALSVIRKALSLRPEDRFQDAGALLEALGEGTRAKSSNDQDPHPKPVLGPGGEKRGFDAIAGLDDLKATLQRDVIDVLRDPERHRRFGLTIPNGLLLYGPPGCGKTFVAERFGEELGFAFRKVRPGDVASIYVHGTQERIKQLFDEARRNAPCALFLDEVDALMPSRDGDLHAAYAGEVNEWLAQMSDCGNDGIFLLAATNAPDRLDVAGGRTGRFDKTVYVGPPDYLARKAMFEIHLADRPVARDVDCGELARMTRGRIASDISFLVNEGARRALAGGAGAIGMEHVVTAIRRNRASVSADQLERYEKMRETFESGPRQRRIGF